MAQKTTFERISPKPPVNRRGAHRVAVLAFDGVVLGDLSTPCEVFGRVRRSDGSAAYEIRVCSLVPEIVSEHVGLKVPSRLGFLRQAETIIVPGIENIDHPVPKAVIDALRRAIDRGARIASVCSGAFVLAQTGALDGLRATTHWLGAGELARRHPTIDVDANVLYVDNGQLLTSAGATAAFDLCLHLVRKDVGAAAAAAAARAAVMPLERAGGQAQFIVHETPGNPSSLSPLLLWIDTNLRRELSLPRLARHAGMSTRTLSRRFREQVGTTPAHWIASARVRRARSLLETLDLSVEEIATQCGFRSATVLREHFSVIVGTSPVAYRSAFWRGVG